MQRLHSRSVVWIALVLVGVIGLMLWSSESTDACSDCCLAYSGASCTTCRPFAPLSP